MPLYEKEVYEKEVRLMAAKRKSIPATCCPRGQRVGFAVDPTAGSELEHSTLADTEKLTEAFIRTREKGGRLQFLTLYIHIFGE